MATKADFFKPENAREDKRFERLSSSGKYKLVVTPYQTTSGGWDYTQGCVYDSDGNQIAEVRRNYGVFPHSFIENHPNGHDYLLCGENYQGQTVIELDTGKRVDYLPKAADQGFGFCWADYHPSPDGTMIAVEGCFWACPYEVWIVDFSEPLDTPWPILLRDYNHEEFIEWEDANNCKISGSCVKYSKIHGKSEDDLTDEELEELERLEEEGQKHNELWEKKTDDVITWSRPSYFEAADHFVNGHMKNLMDRKIPCPADTFEDFGALAAKLSDQEVKLIREKNPEVIEWFKKELKQAEMRMALK